MAQHVRVDVPKPSPLPSYGDQIIDRMPRQRCSAFRHKQPGQFVIAAHQELADGA